MKSKNPLTFGIYEHSSQGIFAKRSSTALGDSSLYCLFIAGIEVACTSGWFSGLHFFFYSYVICWVYYLHILWVYLYRKWLVDWCKARFWLQNLSLNQRQGVLFYFFLVNHQLPRKGLRCQCMYVNSRICASQEQSQCSANQNIKHIYIPRKVWHKYKEWVHQL